VESMFYILERKEIGDIGDFQKKKSHARYASKFEMGLSPRMHQTSNNRYNPNGYGSLRVTPIAFLRTLSCQHDMVQNRFFLSICILLILPSVIINNKDLLKTRLICNFFCKNDCNNFLLLNTNA